MDGIFCLEGEWDGRLTDRASVEPYLRVLSNVDCCGEVIHRDFNGEFALEPVGKFFGIVRIRLAGAFEGFIHLRGDRLLLGGWDNLPANAGSKARKFGLPPEAKVVRVPPGVNLKIVAVPFLSLFPSKRLPALSKASPQGFSPEAKVLRIPAGVNL